MNETLDLTKLLGADLNTSRSCFWLDQNLTGTPYSEKGTNVWISFIPCTALPSGSLPKGMRCKPENEIVEQMKTYRVNMTLLSDEYEPDVLEQKA